MKGLFAQVVVLVLVLFLAASRASVLSDALSAAFVDVVADDDLYSDCYSPYGLDIDPPDVSGCAVYPDEPSGALATVLQNKKIRFGISPFEPFSMPPANGTSSWDGSEIKLAQKIANKLGAHYGVGAIAVEWVWMVEQTNFFDKLWGGLKQAKYEAVMSSVTITAARSAVVDFGCNYFVTYQGLLRGPREPTRNFTVIPNQLNSPTVKIGCLGGTTGMAWVDATLPNAEKHLYINESVLVNAVKSSEVHFGVSDKAILAYGLKVQHPPCPSCSLLDGDFGTGDQYGIFTLKDSAPTPTPTPSPTPKPTPKPKPHDLKQGTIFSLITIGIFAAVILAGVGVGLYVHFNKKTEFIGGN